MPDDGLRLRLMVTAGLTVAGVGAALAMLLYVIGRAAGQRLLSPVGGLRPGLPGVAVVGAFGLLAAFNLAIAVVHQVLIAVGFYRAVYGADFPTIIPPDPTGSQKAAQTVQFLWAAAFTFPFQLAAIIALVRRFHLPNPFPARQWRMNVAAGYLTWLIVTPAAFAVFVLAVTVHLRLTNLPPEKHPLTELGDAVGPLEWGLFVLQTVIIAPVLEEWLFRGMVLGWLARSRPTPPGVGPLRRSWLVTASAAALATALAWRSRPVDLAQAFAADWAGTAATYLVPGLFLLLFIPVEEVLVRMHRFRRHLRLRSPQQVRAIVASSALFAGFHAGVWPSPVPLVVLAIGLGYLYLRTRSLVGPIVVHGMFNAVSATYLLIGGPP
ncbi:MAG TPA: CPBP family intramembrane glutamic endopeptidase [Gemmataceae bacterium]|nr:CPBP family intramembrane glutamic endopeptidase [Gemmataceae bacterium]